MFNLRSLATFYFQSKEGMNIHVVLLLLKVPGRWGINDPLIVWDNYDLSCFSFGGGGGGGEEISCI